MPRKPNRKIKRNSRSRPRSGCQNNPETEFRKSVLRVRLDAFQIAGLKRLAKAHGTTLAQEFDDAVDAYSLYGLNREEVRMLDALVDRLREATASARKAVDAALRKTEENLAQLTRKQRSGQRR